MTIKEIFDSMEYGPAPESAADALAWIVDQGSRFGCYIDGAFQPPGDTFDTKNPATGEVLAEITQATQADVDAAVAAARTAQPGWSALGGHGRARVLYALARLLQKHARLFAVLETLDNGKPIRESRDIDIPLAQRHFYYHAGQAELMDDLMPGRDPIGVCGQIVPWNFPLLMLAWKIAPALAMGNTVVLKPAEWTSLTALLFADICQQAGVPKGVVNIVTGDGAVGEMIVAADVDKIAFTGSTAVGRQIRQATAGTGKALTLELGGKSPYIVFDDADIDSAIEGLIDAIWFNQGQVCCAGSRLLLQEGIADDFVARLKTRMATLRIGNPLDKGIDIGAMVDPEQCERVARMVADTTGEVFQPDLGTPDGCYYPPTLVTGLTTSDPLMQDEVFGPVLATMTFRTPSEAVALANNTRYGLAASVWSENINLALDVAPKLEAGVVWVNATNLFDAAAPFGGLRESGFGREGGTEGLLAYTRPKGTPSALPNTASVSEPGNPVSPIDRTAKLYIGGKQARPDSGYSRPAHGADGSLIGHVSLASRKDVRNAVEAAHAANSWAKTSGHLRAQILYFLAENLSARAGEFAARLDLMRGGDAGADEVESAIARLFTYAAWADKYDGAVRSVPIRGTALALRRPVGVIGALCPSEAPLLGLVTVMGAAMSMGNRAILVAPEDAPLIATDFYQVLDTSDVPGGVVNILTGNHTDLASALASHLNVDSVWSFSSAPVSAEVEKRAAGNLKRTWVNNGLGRDWTRSDANMFLSEATDTQSVWIPWGE